MGRKTSIVPQMDFLEPSLIKKSHRATKLTGDKNTQIFMILKTTGIAGITAEEVEQLLGWMPLTAGPRLSELKALGLARKTEACRKEKYIWLWTGQEP